MWPPRHLLRTIEAVSIPLRQSGAAARAREAHGVQPNSRHVPSSRGARELAKTRFNKVFAIADVQARFPGGGKGLNASNGEMLSTEERPSLNGLNEIRF